MANQEKVYISFLYQCITLYEYQNSFVKFFRETMKIIINKIGYDYDIDIIDIIDIEISEVIFIWYSGQVQATLSLELVVEGFALVAQSIVDNEVDIKYGASAIC
ncbi:MAG: hypothetical protein V5786_11010 [Psychromonas sp.]